MQRRDSIRQILVFAVAGNASVALAKILGGLLSGSTALLADGSDSILNVVSSSLAYHYYSRSREPPDAEHPYGHARLEVYGSMLILLLMAVTFSFIGFTAFDRFTHGEPERVRAVGVAFAAASLALNLAVSKLLGLYGRDSQVALTESRHISLDVAEGAVTLAGVTLGSLISAYYDLAATAVILALVAYFMYKTLGELKSQIVDTSPSEGIVRLIGEEARLLPGVRGVHALRARVVGGRLYTDMHLEVDPDLSVGEAHKLCDLLERTLKHKLGGRVDVTIHVEPHEEHAE